jgi:plasmid stabilization system protein ParE
LLRQALADLDQAAEFISQDNPEAAKSIVKRIRDAARLMNFKVEYFYYPL